MDLKKKSQDVSLRKKSQLLKKKKKISYRNARKYSKSKIDFKNVFLRVFRHFDSQFYIFFEKLRLFYIRHVIFRLGFARVHNDFFKLKEQTRTFARNLRRFYYTTLYRKHKVNTTKNWNPSWNRASFLSQQITLQITPPLCRKQLKHFIGIIIKPHSSPS